MRIGLFDIFKIGIGPSSSHTIGPMIAANRFNVELYSQNLSNLAQVKVFLYGSLAFTGKGHATDKAIILGLLGFHPETLDPEEAQHAEQSVLANKRISAQHNQSVQFDPAEDIVFDFGPPLSGHTNGMKFCAYDSAGSVVFEKCYYSIGGGFVLDEDELEKSSELQSEENTQTCPYPFTTARELLSLGKTHEISIAEMMRVNETARMSNNELEKKIDHIWSVMDACIKRGLQTSGELPGGLQVKRRAQHLHEKLQHDRFANNAPHHGANEWLSLFAMAVNEENAAGGQVVTAPTNGAAGVIPAVLRYYLDFHQGADQEGVRTFLLAAAAIGVIIKKNASISGAEVGCQGEVGSASAMAAAGFCAALGGTNEQIENAAEIALEHHLGMTCDPVKGLVQVPCIERNGIGAVKAVTACSLALRGDGTHIMPLDNCIETMRQTGEDMSHKYKETSLGGLAVNIPEC